MTLRVPVNTNMNSNSLQRVKSRYN